MMHFEFFDATGLRISLIGWTRNRSCYLLDYVDSRYLWGTVFLPG